MKVIVGGAGEVGRHLAGLLSERGNDVVLIDEGADILAAAEEGLDVQVLEGDLSSRRVLRQAGADRADAMIAVTGSDDANVLGAALAHNMGARTSVARVDQPSFYERDSGSEHGLLGIEHILCTARLAAAELLSLMERSEVSFVHGFAAGSALVALWTAHASSAALGTYPEALVLGNVCVGGVARDGFFRAAAGAGRIEPGDRLLLAGPPEAMSAAFRRLRGTGSRERAVVVGGGEIGAIIAATLAARGRRVDLIEAERARCAQLAAVLGDVNVLHGDPTDLAFLKDIRFQEADTVVSVTDAEEVNLLTTLLVPHLEQDRGRKLPHTFVSVRRHGYANLCRKLGIEGTISSFEVLSRAILEAIAPPGLVCAVELPSLAWSALHLRLPSALSREMTASELPLPPGCAPLVRCRREVAQICAPGTPLTGGDELLVVAPTRERALVVQTIEGLAARKVR